MVFGGLSPIISPAVAADEDQFNLNRYRSVVNRTACLKSQRSYFACVASLKVLLNGIDPRFNLKSQTTGRSAVQDRVANLILDSNNLVLVKPKSLFNTSKAKTDLELSPLAEYAAEQVRLRSEFLSTFGPAYHHAKVSDQDSIAEVIDFAESHLGRDKSDRHVEHAVVAAINEFNQVGRDPHSTWRSEEDIRKSMASNETVFVGLGIQFVQTSRGATIMNVVPGSGAEEAGLRPDDSIVSVNSKTLLGLSRDQVASLIRGPVGGQLRLEVLRDAKRIQVIAYRREVKSQNVQVSEQRIGSQSVGLIRLESFMVRESCDEIRSALTNFESNHVKALVFDLRGNGGGLLDLSECIAGLFIGGGHPIAYREQNLSSFRMNAVFYPPKSQGSARERARKLLRDEALQLIEEGGPENMKTPLYQDMLNQMQSPEAENRLTREIELFDHNLALTYSRGTQAFTGGVSVLIDANSASASELVSGALKDLNRAFVIGQRSFGKGSVQSPTESSGGYRLYSTEGLFFLPSGKTHQTTGVVPHIEVSRQLQTSPAERYALREKDLYLFPLEPRSISGLIPESASMDRLKPNAECIVQLRIEDTYRSVTSSKWKDMQVLTGAAAALCALK